MTGNATPGAALKPRGLRNNNPCNIRSADTFVWRGQDGRDEDGFAVFEAPCWGVRAAAILWLNYHIYHGCTCLRDYITRWAPPSGNDTEAYIHFMAQRLAVNPLEPLDIHARAEAILLNQSIYEQGRWCFTQSDLTRGITLAHER